MFVHLNNIIPCLLCSRYSFRCWRNGKWWSRRTYAHLLPWELQNYTSLLNHWWWMLDPTKKKDTPCARAKENPQQESRRGEIVFRIKHLTHQRHSEGSNKPHVHQDPKILQRLSHNCVWMSPAKVQVSSSLPQGRGRVSGCSRPGYDISPFGGGHH